MFFFFLIYMFYSVEQKTLRSLFACKFWFKMRLNFIIFVFLNIFLKYSMIKNPLPRLCKYRK